MLTLYSQFILQQGIRAPIYLMSPTIIPQEDTTLPRYSVIHLLDNESGSHFPDRSSYYFREVPKAKKIPVHHVLDLEVKEETTVLNNKHLPMEVRRWNKANLRNFKEKDLLESPNIDVNMVAVVNYNPLKELYNYKTSPLSEYHKHRNLSTTFWNQVKRFLDADKESLQMVPISIPSAIPGFMMMNRILGFRDIKLMRVVGDPALLWVLEVYQWLLNETRQDSPLKDITDDDAQRVIIEFKFRGYSAFLPLHIIRSVAEESELVSAMKVGNERLQKLFILLLRKIQDQVTTVLDLQTDIEIDIEQDRLDRIEDNKEIPYEDQEEEKDPEPVSVPIQALVAPEGEIQVPFEQTDIKTGKVLSSKPTKEVPEFDVELPDNIDISGLIDSELDNDSFIDSMFEEKVTRVNSQPLSTVSKVKEISKTINPDMKELELDSSSIEEELTITDLTEEQVQDVLKTKPVTKISEDYIRKAVENKTHTAAELRSLRKLQETRVTLKSPYNEETIDSYNNSKLPDITLSDDLIGLEIDNNLIPDNLKSNRIRNFDKQYLNNIYKKDVVSSVASLEKAGIVIKNYEKEETLTSTDRYETHKLTLKPLDGKESTVYFRLPKIDSEGSFMVGGVKYRMRKLRTPVPICKISPTRVAVSSNYGKFFVSRTDRKASDKDDYIISFIRKDYLGENTVVNRIVPGVKYLHKKNLPNTYNLLSGKFDLVETKDYTFLLKEDDIINHVKPEVAKVITSKDLFFIGYTKSKDILVLGRDEIFYNFSKNMTPLGTVEEILGLDIDKVPRPFSVMKVLGTDIPLGVCLAYYMGLSALISVTKTKWKTIGPRQQHAATSKELVLRFEGHKLILETDTVEKQLLFNGFLFYKDSIKQYSLSAFDSKDVYLNITQQRKTGLIHLKELGTLYDLFLDPITIDVLRGMNEPTDFLPLLLRANELLKDYEHPDINDPNFTRIRGYDRVPGLMYAALAESVREYRIKGRSNSKIALDPYKVWNYITQDSSVKSRDELNPILSLKEDEAITLSGRDGMSNAATPDALRRYHKNDAGLISEGTVDSKDVALTSYLSPYAKLDGVRGTVTKGFDELEENPSKVFSTPVQIAPLSEYDDGKRINFVGLQYSHSIPSSGYKQSPMRTGYEYILPHKVGSKFCVTAEEDGIVTDIDDKTIKLKYKSGLEKSYQIGTQYGSMEGSIYTHTLICDLKKGSKVKKTDPIAYHKDFFERDWLDKTKLVMKTTAITSVALTMNNEVFEDSSAISRKLAGVVTTEVVSARTFVLEFTNNIVEMLPVGTKVGPEDVLFMALDETSDGSNLSEQTIAMLQNLAALAPRAKMDGIVDRVEIKYNGDLSDMSPTVRKLAVRLDKELYDRTKGTEYEAKTNKVSGEYRSSGKGLNLDTFELKIYVRVPLRMSIGDKLVFANQMKSVVGEVFTYDIHTESGDEVDAMFGYQGIINRIVNSPIIMGTTNRLLRHFGKSVVEAYFKK